ncbi:MAG TPA: GAF domain-containing protein [Longimicrobiaceae bacterium]|nr:GAF domain-containing protein [Longimicrobiaceae bacterium]
MPRSAAPASHALVRDPSRLAALRQAALLDTPAEEGFDRLARLAARLLSAPVALVTLVDEDRQFFKSCIGLPEPWASRRETPLSHSFCQHAVASREPLVIADAREDPLVRDNLAIRDLGVIAYLGVPLITSEGYELGSFCVIDTQPREWTDEEVRTVKDLAVSVLSEIELRVAVRELKRMNAELRAGIAPGSAVRDRNRWKRDGVRLRRIEALALRSSYRLASGCASVEDVAFSPQDVLWLTGKLSQLRAFQTPAGAEDEGR